MKGLFCTVLAAVLITASGCSSDTEVVEAAKIKTVSWLSLTDTEQYAASWESSAALFQSAISKNDWVQSLNAVRTPIGTLRAREVASSSFSTTLPGAPDGEYVVFEFSSSFENKASALETVTAMKDSDGEWRVAGYFIK